MVVKGVIQICFFFCSPTLTTKVPQQFGRFDVAQPSVAIAGEGAASEITPATIGKGEAEAEAAGDQTTGIDQEQ